MRTLIWLLALAFGYSVNIEAASAQTKTPNSNQPNLLRSWPASGKWVTVLAHTKDPGLACGMVSGHAEAGTLHYSASLVQRPNVLSIVLSDRNPASLASTDISLLIDGVNAGTYQITNRDDTTENHSIRADLPDSETARIITLLSTGADVKFVTKSTTYDYPLEGAAQAIRNLVQCYVEMKNLSPTDKK